MSFQCAKPEIGWDEFVYCETRTTRQRVRPVFTFIMGLSPRFYHTQFINVLIRMLVQLNRFSRQPIWPFPVCWSLCSFCNPKAF